MLHIVIILLQNTPFYPKVSVSPVTFAWEMSNTWKPCKALLTSLQFVTQKWFDAYMLSIKHEEKKNCHTYPKNYIYAQFIQNHGEPEDITTIK